MSAPGAFAQSPFIAIWETTRACALACVHCRAEAVPRRDSGELTTGEARALIDRVRAFGDPPPLLVLTGGDPLRRPDVQASRGPRTESSRPSSRRTSSACPNSSPRIRSSGEQAREARQPGR